MRMFNKHHTRRLNKRRSSRLLPYVMVAAVGISLTLTLVYIAFIQALDNNKRAFPQEASSLKKATLDNVRTAHQGLEQLAGLLVMESHFNQVSFNVLSSAVLDLTPYVGGIALFVFEPAAAEDADANGPSNGPSNGDTDEGADENANKNAKKNGGGSLLPPGRFLLRYEMMRGAPYFAAGHDISADKSYHFAMQVLAEQDVVASAAVPADAGSKNQDYWLLKVLRTADLAADNTQRPLGILGVLVEPDKLLGPALANPNFSVNILKDAIGLSGRQRLYDMRPPGGSTGWVLRSSTNYGAIQFPQYSIRLAISQDASWAQLDKSFVYITLLIGVGVTLLLVAILRARDQQTRHLRERKSFFEQRAKQWQQIEQQAQELILARDKAIEASRVKSEFLAGMSHEIRTPLNAIIGMAELLSETPLSDEQKNYISVFRKASDTLIILVDDILDLSKIEASQLVLENIEFDLLETVEECVEIYALQAAEKGLELLSCIDNDLGRFRIGDSIRLRQILMNLISNAVKFTEAGEIVVRVQRDGDTDARVLFSVSDTGIGISKEKLEAIFGSFIQADSSTTRRYGGTGLGLAISQRLVKMMDGKAWVESEAGLGSVFMFTASLPLAQAPDAADVDDKVDLSNKTILLVDDHTVRGEIISSYLEDANARVKQLPVSNEALEVLGSAVDNFDLFLFNLDTVSIGNLRLALKLARKVKQQHDEHRVIVMLHAAELNRYLDKLQKTTVDVYLIKPIKKQDLLQKVSDLLFRKDQARQADMQALVHKPQIKPLNILLADDNADNRLLIRTYLKDLPYRLDETENGQLAVDKFKHTDYDLVLMDIQMPVMDGEQATRLIRAWEQESGRAAKPIVALTAHTLKEEVDKYLAAGCDRHLGKPVKKKVLIDTVQSIAEDA